MRRFGLSVALITAAAFAFPMAAQTSLSRDVQAIDQKDMPGTFSELSSRLMPAVVNISTSQTIQTGSGGLPEFPDGSPMEKFNEFFGRDEDGFRKQGALGSGFVISPDGLVVTNNHVIENADEIEVNFSNGRVLKATILGRDVDSDIALMKVNSPMPLPYVDFADSEAAEVGDWVIAIGNPFGFGGSVSAGIISAKSRDLNSGRSDNFIQTDAAINRGNSGGPLFNMGGQVVGVNTAIISPTGGSVGIGFSVPANLVKNITAQLKAEGKVRRGWLGVNVQDADKDLVKAFGADGKGGVILTAITSGGPAERAGLQIGDLILSFNDRPIEGVRDLTRTVAEATIDADVKLNIVRDGRRQTVTAKLGELEQADTTTPKRDIPDIALSNNDLGAELGAINDDSRRRYKIAKNIDGVLVTGVSPRGAAFGKLKKGDVITEIGFEPMLSVEDATKAVEFSKAQGNNRPLLVRVSRQGRDIFFSITLKK